MRLLFVTYEFPPKGGTGVQRPLATARYLAESGWDVTVLTVADPPTSLRDEGLLGRVPASVRVARAWSLEPTRVVQALRRSRAGEREDGAAEGGGRAGAVERQPEPGAARGYTGLSPAVVRAIQAFFVPDEKYWWTPFATRLARRLHREAPFDCIIASGPPFTALGIARRLGRAWGVPWVADLRDPIVGGYFFRPATPLHRALMHAYERRVVSSAAAVITVTEGMRLDIIGRHPDAAGRVVTIANGYEAADFEGPPPPAREGFEVAYVGTFQGSITPDTLLAAFVRARAENAGFASDARLALIGPRDARTDARVAESGLAAHVERTGFVSHAEAVARMRSAAVLVVVLGDDDASKAIFTGKLPEYLAAGRPVLALVPPDGVAAGVVRRAGAGWVVPPGDVAGATAALLSAYGAWREGRLPAPDAEVVGEFDRRALVRAVSRVMERVVAEGAAS